MSARNGLPGPDRMYALPPSMTVGGTAFFGKPRGEWTLKYFRVLLLASLRALTKRNRWKIRAKQVKSLNGVLITRVS